MLGVSATGQVDDGRLQMFTWAAPYEDWDIASYHEVLRVQVILSRHIFYRITGAW